MKLTPVGPRVLVKRTVAASVSPGGIHIPDVAKDKPQEAEVVAVGTGEFSVKVGDKVIITKFGGTEIWIDGQEHLLLSEDDILAILNG